MIQFLKDYFEKDATLKIHYLHSLNDGKVKDSFSISVCQYGKCHEHFGRIPWEDAGTVLKTLKNSKGQVMLSLSIGMGESNILIPKWAKKQLIERLEEEM